MPNKNFFIAFFSISVARDLSETINITATAYCLVADVRLIPTSSTPQAVNILRDHVARLRTFNATTRFSNMTGKWRAGQRFCPSKIHLQNGTRTIWNPRKSITRVDEMLDSRSCLFAGNQIDEAPSRHDALTINVGFREHAGQLEPAQIWNPHKSITGLDEMRDSRSRLSQVSGYGRGILKT
ncbi:hypothetical protein GALL_532750 [mine drainage metagenome]|uniref:Uncharacterized protein n=1 Tax=mine drainage metagenome TaxID=410659 RepID=A0A1J5P0V2_9ZZZZ